METNEFIVILTSIGTGYMIGNNIGYPITGTTAGLTTGAYILNSIRQHKQKVKNNIVQQQKLKGLFNELTNKYKNDTKTLWNMTNRHPSACLCIVELITDSHFKANMTVPTLPNYQRMKSETFGMQLFDQLKKSDFTKTDMWPTYIEQVKEVNQRLRNL